MTLYESVDSGSNPDRFACVQPTFGSGWADVLTFMRVWWKW